jgi:D-glycero-D-manno-heptose 1,7-bisphosphate phosphatase
MDLLILCGGMATRLGEITARTPKILVEVAGRPLLYYLLATYVPHFERIFLLSGHLGSQLLLYATPQLRVVVEPERLDTGGAVLNILGEVSEQFAVVNGDTYFEGLDLADICRTAPRDAGLIVVTPGDCSCGGCVEMDGDRVLAFHEKTKTGPGDLYSGFGVFSRRLLGHYERGRVSLERVILPDLVSRGLLVAYRAEELQMFDIGTPERLDRFSDHIESQSRSER